MGEIKSTIELMMERTKDMRLSPEEKEAAHREECLKKARGLRLRLLGGEAPDAVFARPERDSAEDRTLVQTLLWQVFLENLPPNEAALDHLDIMAALPGAKTKESAQARPLLKEAFKEAATERRKMLNRERKRLANFGISGTAVAPRPTEGWVAEAAQRGLEKARRLLS
jgi:hypothetical protein